MDDMSRGLRGWFKRGGAAGGSARGASAADSTARSKAAEPAEDDFDLELHVCCICGALLGFDREDEIDGEGPGRDICGSCNRSRNDDSIEFGW
jgi:hypothetical protein